jgi:hypothetical protein
MTAAMSLVSSVVLTVPTSRRGRRDAGAPRVAPWSCATGDLPADHTVAFMIAIGKGIKPAWPKPGQLPLDEVVIENRFRGSSDPAGAPWSN